MPVYLHVANKVLIGKGLKAKQFLGAIVASRQAFFMHLASGELGLYGGLVGGIVGAIAGALLESAAKTQRQIMEIDLSDLPAEISGHPDWPIKRKKGRLVVVPRSAVISVRYSFWTTFDLQTDAQVFRVELRFLARRRILGFLRDAGWHA